MLAEMPVLYRVQFLSVREIHLRIHRQIKLKHRIKKADVVENFDRQNNSVSYTTTTVNYKNLSRT